ncbi:MAG: ABC transporter permease [Acidobacteriota bacterium]
MPPLFLLRECLRFAIQALHANKVRTALTALGLVIGNASVILVVTISLTSRGIILDKIRGIGSNLVMAYYDAGGQEAARAAADFVKLADVEAVRARLADRIVAASAVLNSTDTVVVDGRPLDVRIIGTDEYYAQVRSLQLLAGRFLDPSDVALRQKVAMLDDKLARTLFGGPATAVGRILKIRSLEFTIIGVFRERTSTFGQSELGDHGAALIPFSVQRYFVEIERVDPMYVQVRHAEDVPAVTQEVADILASRHRPGARYTVQNLSAILDAAATIATVLTLVLILISAIALVISGIGIMNIMLVTVTERTREIGIRMSLGASRRVILLQFLFEALLISIGGGALGILLGLSLPVLANSLQNEVYIPVSRLSIFVAFLVSGAVGVGFGLLPANRAARLNPTEALRYE